MLRAVSMNKRCLKLDKFSLTLPKRANVLPSQLFGAELSGAGRHWRQNTKRADVFDAKADVLSLLQSLGVSIAGLQIAPCSVPWFHPGRSATLQFGPKAIIGHFGELHPRALKTLDIEGDVSGFEIILNALPAPKIKPTKMKPKLEISDLQPLTRDFAFIVDQTAKAGDLLKAVASADRDSLHQRQYSMSMTEPAFQRGKNRLASLLPSNHVKKPSQTLKLKLSPKRLLLKRREKRRRL